jgi:hypothetical protein
MSARAALVLALLLVVSLLGFGAVLVNVPLPAVIGGCIVASAIIVWRVGWGRREKGKDASIPP